MPSINSARYAQRIIQTESHESPSFLKKVHRLDPPDRMGDTTRPVYVYIRDDGYSMCGSRTTSILVRRRSEKSPSFGFRQVDMYDSLHTVPITYTK